MAKLRPITWAAIAGVLLAGATLVILIQGALSSTGHTCEVCMTFRGQSLCREAVGRTPEEATETATDNACALLGARGMALSIECSKTAPDTVTCSE
jgi:hypothetical protein